MDVALWLVIDVAERPDLVASMADGTIRIVVCPRCRHAVRSTDALMFYRPNPFGKTTMFLVTDQNDDNAWRREGEPLAQWVTSQEGVAAEDTYVIVTDWEHAGAVAERDFQSDVETPDALLSLPASFGNFAAAYREALHGARREAGLEWVTDLADDLPPISYTERIDSQHCPECGSAIEFDVPMIVTDRPGLSNQVRAGELSSFRCPGCRKQIPYNSLLFVWRPRRSPRILMLNSLPAALAEKTFVDLLNIMRERLGHDFRDEWISQIQIVATSEELATEVG